MDYNYKKIIFLKSFYKFKDINFYSGSEIALLGYSNVGKSTLINVISRNNKLSRTSKHPGQTKLINFFQINKEFRIVDLPGYGYSKNSIQSRKKINLEVNKYIQYRSCLCLGVLVMDIRYPIKKMDLYYLKILVFRNLKILIVLNKSDKVKKKFKKNIFDKVFLFLKKTIKKNFEILIFSYRDHISVSMLRNKIFFYYKKFLLINS